MQALVISDLHFGAWTTDGVLARPFARERLAPLLDDIDELVLLGDVFDIQFGLMEGAFEEAEPFFDLVRDKLQGKRVVFTAGNHDHHVVVRTLRDYSETTVATGVNTYEAVMVPMGELLFTVAQMPGGMETQRGLLQSFERYARVLRALGIFQREAHRVRNFLVEAWRNRAGDDIADRGRSLTMTLQQAGAALREDAVERGESAFLQLAQPGSGTTAPVALRAYGQVARNLGWASPGTSLVFGHT